MTANRILGRHPVSRGHHSLLVMTGRYSIRSVLVHPLSTGLLSRARMREHNLVSERELCTVRKHRHGRRTTLTRRFKVGGPPSSKNNYLLARGLFTGGLTRLHGGNELFSGMTIRLLGLKERFLLPKNNGTVINHGIARGREVHRLMGSKSRCVLHPVNIPKPAILVRMGTTRSSVGETGRLYTTCDSGKTSCMHIHGFGKSRLLDRRRVAPVSQSSTRE